MLKKFTWKDDVSTKSQVKSSVQRAIRAKLVQQFPAFGEYFEDILTKKDPIFLVKCKDHLNLVTQNNKILFFNYYDGPYYPHLKLLHEYPDILPKIQVDKGAIKFVLQGANIMCPGLTSPGAKLDDGLSVGTVVAIMAEGKEHAIGVGIMKMSGADIKKINKGHGVDTTHYIGDGLFQVVTFE